MRLLFCLTIFPLPLLSTFRHAPCAFETPKGEIVECGWLRVPECRSNPGSRSIELHTARYRSKAPRPSPHPIVWLVGGPGGEGHTLSTALFDKIVKPYLSDRDFIVIDPRGVGHSKPALHCKSQDHACYQSLKAIGTGISCYNSAEFASDLEDLRKALRIRQWHVIGESYGTHLALVYMRKFPAGVRSVILDSVLPPEFDNRLDDRRWMFNAIRRLEANCSTDPACRAAYPRIQPLIDAAFAAVRKRPLQISGVRHSTPYSVVLNPDSLGVLLFLMLYEAREAGHIPAALVAVSRGEAHRSLHRAASLQAIIQQRLANPTVNVLWSCNDSAALPGYRRKCEETGLAQTLKTDRTSSHIPTLILNGEYDPATPPEAAYKAAETLPRGQLFILPGYGHMVTADGPCPVALIREFLREPTRRLSQTCAATLRTQWESPPRPR